MRGELLGVGVRPVRGLARGLSYVEEVDLRLEGPHAGLADFVGRLRTQEAQWPAVLGPRLLQVVRLLAQQNALAACLSMWVVAVHLGLIQLVVERVLQGRRRAQTRLGLEGVLCRRRRRLLERKCVFKREEVLLREREP